MSTPVIDEVSTFIHYCQRGNITGVTEYVANYPSVLNEKDKAGWNGLHYAAHGDHPDVVQKLVDSNIKLDEINGSGDTALHIAASRGYIDILLTLGRAGADPNVKNVNGHSAFDVAVDADARQAIGGFDPRVPATAGGAFLMAETDSDSDY
jgi:ankyrin repeat protein